MRRGELCPLADWCTVTRGVEEIQHFVTSAVDNVSHRAEVPTARVDADPGSSLQALGVSQASQPTAATRNTGWGNRWHNLAGCCASVNIIFLFWMSVLVGWMKWLMQNEVVVVNGRPSYTLSWTLGRAELGLSPGPYRPPVFGWTRGAQPWRWVHSPGLFSLPHTASHYYCLCGTRGNNLGFIFELQRSILWYEQQICTFVWLWKLPFPSPSSWTKDTEDRVHKAVLGNLTAKML